MKKINVKDIVKYASVAAIYVVLTMVFSSFSFGPIQLRISEALVLLCFFDKKYFIPLTLGCFVSNLMSPYPLDILFGTVATMISLFFICCSKNLFVASLFPVIFNGVIIAVELSLLEEMFNFEIFLLNMGTIALGEFISVSIIGVILFRILQKNKDFMDLIKE